ncbi:uncharacterized protein [Euwallacea fornicatus]|uniref:uncharacterized protein n=1 Tax=Euwallacea fornicatus TaxID=995702 RepID=UPI00338F0970
MMGDKTGQNVSLATEMNCKIVIIFMFLSYTHSDKTPIVNYNGNTKSAQMNQRIKVIAREIVDKWIEEGLNVSKQKVEGWIDILDKSKRKNAATATTSKPVASEENLGGNFKEVRDIMVETFSKIGQVKCETCKKNEEMGGILDKPQSNRKSINGEAALDSLSIEELRAKQKAIQQFAQMGKMAQLVGGLRSAPYRNDESTTQSSATVTKFQNVDEELKKMSIEELLEKQKAIQQFAQMGKMVQLIGSISNLTKTTKKTTPREEL